MPRPCCSSLARKWILRRPRLNRASCFATPTRRQPAVAANRWRSDRPRPRPSDGVSRGFVEFLKDQLSAFGPVSVRPMFGGAGIYRDGVMFALIAGEVLYLKADEQTKAEFEDEGLAPFAYATRGGSNTIMSYWRAPERCLDDPDARTESAATAWAAAVRVRKP